MPPRGDPALVAGEFAAPTSERATGQNPAERDALVAREVTEYCFLTLPLKTKGGTGSPVGPVAIV